MENPKERSSANSSSTSSEQEVTQESISSSNNSSQRSHFDFKKIIPLLILITIFAVFFIGLATEFNFYGLSKRITRFRTLFVDKIESPPQPKVKTIFSENGKPLEMGLEQQESQIRLVGKFEGPIFEQDGFNIARVITENKSLLLIFSPSDWPIVTLFTDTGEISPSQQSWRGKTKEELNEYIKEEVPFVARVELPSPENESWSSFTKIQQQYLEEIQNELPNEKVGLVKNIIIYNK